MTNKIFSKRAISPVVATALLIVVAVVSVVGFQTWFGDFSSGVFSNTETQSDSRVGNTQIESIIGSSAYFNNAGTENITVTQVKVDGVDCNITTNATRGISEFDISSCLANVTTQTPEVVIYTNEGIYSEKFYMKTPIAASNSTPSVFSGTLEWNRTYSGQILAAVNEAWAKGVKVDGSNNVYVVGNMYDGVTFTNYYIIKYDNSGNEIWNVTYDDGNDNIANAIDLDSNNDVYVTGTSNGNWYTIKYNGSNGNEISNITYDGGFVDGGYGIVIDSSDNFYITGYTENASGNFDYFIAKYNQTINQIWNNTFFYSGMDIAYAITLDSSNNVYITGENNDGSSNNYLTVKYNSTGSYVWNRTYDSGQYDVAKGIDIDSLGRVYVSGGTSDGSTYNYYTIIYNSTNGNQISNITYDGGSDDEANAITIDSGDNVYITGYSYEGSFGNFYTMKYDSSQTLVWAEKFNIFEFMNVTDYPFAVALDSTDNLYVTGYSYNDISNTANSYTIKYNSNGNEILNISSNISNDDISYSIVIDSSNNIYLTGYAYLGGINSDYYTVKYDSLGNILWNVSYDSTTLDAATGIALDSNNDVYITGFIATGVTDMYVIKYDGVTGNELWNYTFDSGSNDYSFGIDVDSSDNVYVSNYDFLANYYIFKFDSNGNLLWNITENKGSFYYIYDLIIDGNDNIYVTGNSGNNYYTIKYDINRVELWNATYDGGTGEAANGIAIDPTNEFVYITGIANDDIYTIKYNASNGDELWSDAFDGGGGQDYGEEIVVDSLGNVYVTGVIDYITSGNYVTLKYS